MATLVAKAIESHREREMRWLRVRVSRIRRPLKRLDRASTLAMEAIAPSFTSSGK